MKAAVKYNHGWVLQIPTQGNAPMLFLEWLSTFKSGKMPMQQVINDNQQDLFKVRFHTINKQKMLECADYINNNL